MTSDAPQPAGSRLEQGPSARARLLHWIATPEARWDLAAAAIFFAAAYTLFHSVLFSDAAAPTLVTVLDSKDAGWSVMSMNDLRFVVSVLAHNSRALVEAPGRIFDLPQCYPTEHALALGEPVITSGILGIPAPFLFSEPTAAFNLSLILTTLVAAFAMYALVREWTGSRPAGIVAGLLYAFHTVRVRDPVHFYVWDNAWTLLALLFARRLFVAPRWRDAVALALCAAMQIAGSVYPLLVALIVAVPFAGWLARTYGVREVRWTQIALVVAVGALVAWFALGPFFGLQQKGAFFARIEQVYLPFVWLAPGDRFFFGVVLIVLALIGLVLPGGYDRERLGGDPRILMGVLFVLLLAFATGGLEGERMLARLSGEPAPESWVPNLWLWLVRLLPALDVVRSPAALLSGMQALACLLAGFGAAVLLRRAPARACTAVAVLLIALAWVDTLRPASLGLTPRQHYSTVDLHPPEAALELFRELEAMGNEGPIYELAYSKRLNPRRSIPLITAVYHRRPTSVCYNSFVSRPGESARNRLPDPSGLSELRALGFTTLIVHDPYLHAEGRRVTRALRELAASDPDHTLRLLAATDQLTAYEITAPPLPAPVPAPGDAS